jgi:hypothetical protein
MAVIEAHMMHTGVSLDWLYDDHSPDASEFQPELLQPSEAIRYEL